MNFAARLIVPQTTYDKMNEQTIAK